MAIRKKDFQRVVVDVKEFLSKLSGHETCELRDALNFSLLHLHKYYKKLRHRKNAPLLDGSLSLTSSLNSLTPSSPYFPVIDKFDWRWIHLDAAKLSASFGHGENSNLLPEIFYVIKNGDIEKLKDILEKDNDSVNEVDALGRSTALHCVYGKSNEHLQCLQLLIQYGVDLQHEANDGMTCFHLAAILDDIQIINLLIEKQVNINSEDHEGRYPLHFAAGYASDTIIKTMLSAGADKNCLDNDEMTPVMWACYFDCYENVEILLNITDEDEMKYEAIDAELQDKDLNGKNLLHWSVSRPTNKLCFKLLFSLEYAEVSDDAGRNILHTIAEHGAIGALDEYLSFCDSQYMESLDHKDRTPLHLACLNGHGEIVDVLLNVGACLDAVDKQGCRPFDYAKLKNLNYCMLVMLSHQKYRNQVGEKNEQETVKPALPAQIIEATKEERNHLTPNSTKEKTSLKLPDRPSMSRKSSDVSQFDTPQNADDECISRDGGYQEVNSLQKEIEKVFPEKSNETKEPDLDLDEQMIVLVQHHGSDDEVIIGVDGLSEPVDEASEEELDFDEDLLDAPPFARNGSITTVGVVSEGSMAFNSISVNPSVSSLVGSDESDNDHHKGNKYTPSELHERNVHPTHAKKSPTTQRSPTSPLPPKSKITSSLTNYNSVIAPVPPPSYYHQSNNINSEMLVVHATDHISHENKPKKQKSQDRKARKYLPSEPPQSNSPKGRDHHRTSSGQLLPIVPKLAPLQAPKPPPHR